MFFFFKAVSFLNTCLEYIFFSRCARSEKMFLKMEMENGILARIQVKYRLKVIEISWKLTPLTLK